MQKFDTPAPIAAVLDLPAGRIQLIAADRADTVVEIRPTDSAKSRDLKAAEQIQVSYDDGVLHIHTPEPKSKLLGHSGSVEVTVQLPAGSRIDARTEAGELRGVGRLGEVAFEGAHRRIKVDEAASLHLTATDGDIEVGRLTGPADITTQRGSIRIGEAQHGGLTLRTQQGDITVGAAAGVSATLDAGTTHGRISNTLKNTGTAALTVHATTAQGDITAHSL
jgi:hypothetical protein